MTPAEVRDEITTSGLRGRGGAGLPDRASSGTPSRRRPARPKYVICNADEGDPGAFMDRSVLESDPHRVLEGMAIAAYAVGASTGYVYCRAEYPLAVTRLRKAIREAAKHGLPGRADLDTQFSFEVDVRLGAGAFVCGEETALIASIEGGRGTPRPRPPYPAVAGPVGPADPHQQRRDVRQRRPHRPQRRRLVRRRSGPRRARARRCSRSPVGSSTPASSRSRWARRCGRSCTTSAAGSSTGAPFKAVQTGGPAGGCIPAQFLDMPVDYESLIERRLVHGLGRDDRHGRDHAAWSTSRSTSWTSAARSRAASASPAGSAPPSCGCCSTRSSRGEATDGRPRPDGAARRHGPRTSLCGLGQGAPNPIFSTLRYFRDEYTRAHRGAASARPACATIDSRRCAA